ncbi:sugar phosphate isomerase/epimerase family protein [Microcella sp.]|uniref:sugar phosphate isomerase/epimerase family protein n=1 Tax=Microcella sp. TaxID=1913979 RepID=UPI0025679443|nr:sugar phosphate isomerase/epimerase [Microcella sp.]MBX9472019.1 sugar phosphate isomerase/epimerase [Microcella sp.]
MTRPPMSVQLYTVRDHLEADAAGTIEALAAMGFTAVEPFGLPDLPTAVREALAAHGLATPTAHGSILARTAETITAAAELGVQTIIEPYQDPARFADRESIAAVAAELTAAAEAAAVHGIVVGYHNHGFELSSAVDGVPALLVLAELTDPRVVFELDAYWAAVGGVDPVEIAKTLGDRLIALHVKDGDPAGTIEQQVPAGLGSVPLAEVLVAAPHARPVVEFDIIPGEGLDAIAASARWVTEQVSA